MNCSHIPPTIDTLHCVFDAILMCNKSTLLYKFVFDFTC